MMGVQIEFGLQKASEKKKKKKEERKKKEKLTLDQRIQEARKDVPMRLMSQYMPTGIQARGVDKSQMRELTGLPSRSVNLTLFCFESVSRNHGNATSAPSEKKEAMRKGAT